MPNGILFNCPIKGLEHYVQAPFGTFFQIGKSYMILFFIAVIIKATTANIKIPTTVLIIVLASLLSAISLCFNAAVNFSCNSGVIFFVNDLQCGHITALSEISA